MKYEMKKKTLFIISLSIIFLNSCEEWVEPIDELDCDNLATGLIYYNRELVENEFRKLCEDLTPNVTEGDTLGHEENLEILVSRINTECKNMEAEIGCYACITTSPPISEIIVTTDSLDTMVKRFVSLWTPPEYRFDIFLVRDKTLPH